MIFCVISRMGDRKEKPAVPSCDLFRPPPISRKTDRILSWS